jgi:hypothetical protein
MRFFRRNASLATRRSGFDSRRLHSASVVSTASTRPLYGRGAGSNPPEALTRPVAQRTSSVLRGRWVTWLESDREAVCPARPDRWRGLGESGGSPSTQPHADVAQPAEHRSATPGRPVRSGSSASTSPWCNGSTSSSNLDGPGSNPGGLAVSRSSRAEAVRLSGKAETPPSGFDTRPHEPCGSGLHPTTATTPSAAGRHGPVIDFESTGRGFESRPEHSVLR